MSNETASAIKPQRILLASVVAAIVALIVLFVAVLPAERGYDPLGTGKALGLMGLSESSVKALQQQDGPWHSNAIEFHLAPFEALEYKYYMAENAAMVYSWVADGELVFDLHSEADDKSIEENSFSMGRQSQDSGALRAPFAGIHGWFWHNRTMNDVTIKIQAAGFFPYSVVMRDGGTSRYEFGTADDQ